MKNQIHLNGLSKSGPGEHETTLLTKVLVSCSGFLLGVLFLSSCYTVPETGRSALNLVSPSQEAQLGVKAFQQIKSQEKVSTDQKLNAMVRRVGSRIASAAQKDVPHANWEFVVFDNPEPNAFALPGGKIGVNTGMFQITQNEAGLAAVLGHEIAHISARHSAERLSEQMAIAGLGTGLAIGVGGQSRTTQQMAMLAFGVGTTLGRVLPHSRLQESEADRIGLIYMARAGYDPSEAVRFWERFREFNRKKGGAPPAFLSTHPTDERRIQDIKSHLPEAEMIYKTSGRK
jgi:metalloendopeptidase OMA1, mitochondrial